MASPPWLLSLNSNGNCDLYVEAKQVKESRKEPLEPLVDPSLVHLNITVSATFFSDDPWNDKFVEGLSMVRTQALMSSTIDSPTECRERIRNILADLRVPLELGQTTWRHRFLNGYFYEMRGVEDVDRLIENICWFLYEVKTQPQNRDFTVLPVNLAITRRIVVTDNEFEAWCSWYDKMVDLFPDFEREYAKTTGSPRTEDEFLPGFSSPFNAVNLAIMRRIVVTDDEFEAWCSWYDRMVDLDPDFEREYAKATGSPRTEDEFCLDSVPHLTQ